MRVKRPMLDMFYSTNLLLITIAGLECRKYAAASPQFIRRERDCKMCGEPVIGECLVQGRSAAHKDCVTAGVVMFRRAEALMKVNAPKEPEDPRATGE